MSSQPNGSDHSLGSQAQKKIRVVLDNPTFLEPTTKHFDTLDLPLSEWTIEALAIAIASFVNTESHAHTKAMIDAINLAAELHAPDIRHSRNPQAYIIHPLRNTLRLIRLGVSNTSLLMASVLHDTVEDHPFEMAAKAGLHTTDEVEARESALAFLSNAYGAETARIVEGMSNPIMDKGIPRDRMVELYLEHLASATQDPLVFTCKVSDLIDNAVGLHEEQLAADRMLRMAKKYAPAIQIMLARLDKGEQQGDLPLSANGIISVRTQLQVGHDRLENVLRGTT